VVCKHKSILFGGAVWLLAISQPLSVAVAGETLKNLERELQNLISSAKRSVVTVTAEFSRPAAAGDPQAATPAIGPGTDGAAFNYTNIGTGVIFDAEGHIITRRSIASGAQSTEITCSDGRQLKATVVGEDGTTGFVVLKVEAEDLTPIKLAGDDVPAGGLNIIIGNSLGVYPSVAFGTVNGMRDDGMMQVMASLSPGNGGGPVVNLRGETIGLLAGQMQAPGDDGNPAASQYNTMAVAYPAARIRRIARDIIEFGHVRKGWLGVVGFHNVDAPKVSEIRANSPAERAGLSPGDIITRYSRRVVHNVDELARMVEATTPGDWVELEYQRDSLKVHTSVQIGMKKELPDAAGGQAFSFAAQAGGASGSYQEPPTAGTSHNQNRLEQRIVELQSELNKLRKLVEERKR